MNFQLVTLPKPTSRPYVSAFIYSERGNFLIKGGMEDVRKYLAKLDFPFFGKKKLVFPRVKRRGRQTYLCIAGGGITLKEERGAWRMLVPYGGVVRNHQRYVFKDATFGITLKVLRRLPNHWIPELNVGNPALDLTYAHDFLAERGVSGIVLALLKHHLKELESKEKKKAQLKRQHELAETADLPT